LVATPKIKFGIYEKTGDKTGSLVDYTEEWILTEGWDGWKTLNIVGGASLSATDYWLVIWQDNGLKVYYDTATDKGAYKAETYDGFPTPVTFLGWYYGNFSVYCTYTTVGGQEKTFGLSETCGISDSLEIGKEKASSFVGSCGVESQIVVGKEKLIVFSPIIEIISEMDFSKELSIKIFELFETCNITEALTINKEKTIVLENPFTISSLLGMTKEQKLTLIEIFETVFINSELTFSPSLFEEPLTGLGFAVIALVIALFALVLALASIKIKR